MIGAVARGENVAQPDPIAGGDLPGGTADHVGVGEAVAIEVEQRHLVHVDGEARHSSNHEESRIPLHQHRIVFAREPLAEVNELHGGQEPRRGEAEDPQRSLQVPDDGRRNHGGEDRERRRANPASREGKADRSVGDSRRDRGSGALALGLRVEASTSLSPSRRRRSTR